MPRFRSAEQADITAMANLRVREGGTEAYWGDRIAHYLAGAHHPQLALAPRIAYVAELDGQVVAFIAGHLSCRFDCQGELQWLNTAPEHRRRGLATALLKLLAQWFANHDARRICVNVAEDNAAARAFYLRFGATLLAPHWLVWNELRP
ncbi:MAG TPA: GNAT family N-acetyltransferase [Terriglobales bacterium]|nr:GNAT family N-acetyltransferase [Terriglobales bacterium]